MIETKDKTLEFTEENIRAIFGHEAAEDESVDRLKAYYLKSDVYSKLKSAIPLYILAGHKGIGKSAMFKVLEAEDNENGDIALVIQPDDILELDTDTDQFLLRIRQWKNGLSSVIARKLITEIQIKQFELSTEKSNTFFSWVNKLSSVIKQVTGTKLEEMQGDFTGLDAEKFALIIKNQVFTEKRVTIYLDDLDRGWKNSTKDIANLSAMMNAIRDLSREMYNLRFRIALRSDVYYALRTSDETTDKFDGSVLWQKWTNHEILVMLIKRIESFWGRDVNEKELLKMKQTVLSKYLESVFELRFAGKGKWENAPTHRVMLSMIRKRPRDLVKLCTLAAREAWNNQHCKIMTNDFEKIFATYSSDRLTDTVNEYKAEVTNLQELLLKMKPTVKEFKDKKGRVGIYTKDELIVKLNNLLSASAIKFKDGRTMDAQNLATFLYKINFLTARKDTDDGIERVYYDENRYIQNEYADFGYEFEIHMAYRWALQPSKQDDIFESLDLETN